MGLIKSLKLLSSGNYPISAAWDYMLGNYRYFLYYKLNKIFIRSHIIEQIEYRIKWMDKQCYNEGSCKLCGCETTALQMCNKSCEKPCYPPMMEAKKWLNFRLFGQMNIKDELWWMNHKTGKPSLIYKNNKKHVQHNP